MKNLTFRDFISLSFLLLGIIVLSVALQSYRLKATTNFYQEIDFQKEKNENNHRKIIKEMKILLNKAKISAGRYDVVADKNLFATSRTAWQAPHAADDAAGDKEKKADIIKGKIKQDIILYGTMIRGNEKMAMLEFKRFRRDKPKRLVKEGETISSESGRNRYQYTLVTVDKTSVVVKEEQSGESYTIPLFDTVKKRPAATLNRAVGIQVPTVSGRPKRATPATTRIKSRRLPERRISPSRKKPAVNGKPATFWGNTIRKSEVPAVASGNAGNGLDAGGNPPEKPKLSSNPSVRIRRYHPVVPEN